MISDLGLIPCSLAICSHRRHVALKIYINSAAMGQHLDDELKMYKRMEKASLKHPGRKAVRRLLDSFNIKRPEGEHRCLVHPPLWESVLTFLHRNPIRRLPSPVLAFILQRLFLALDYLHTECQIIHTGQYCAYLPFILKTAHLIPIDIKADNILFGIADDTVFSDFEEEELQRPIPRKKNGGSNNIYVS